MLSFPTAHFLFDFTYFGQTWLIIYKCVKFKIIAYVNYNNLSGISFCFIRINPDAFKKIKEKNSKKEKGYGFYKIVRHPSYLGLFMIFTGLAISMNSILSILVICLPVFLVILYRIYVEETVLSEEFGDKYRDYKKTTRKIIPFIY